MQVQPLYLRALKAEYNATDFNAWHYAKRCGVSWIPHACIVHPFLIALARRTKFLLPVLIPLWLSVGIPVYILSEIASLRRHSRGLCIEHLRPVARSIFLGSSICESLHSIASIQHLPEIYLHLPWRPLPRKLPEGMICIDLVEVLQKGDIVRAFWETWIATARICVNPKHWHLVAYTYMGFRWHLVGRVLHQMKPSEIWISNHYDRWAILVDDLKFPPKTMVQHGELTMISAVDNSTVTFGPDPKLISAWRLFHFTNGALEQFSRYVFAHPPAAHQAFSMRLEMFSPKLDTPVLLIIGSPVLKIEQSAEMQLIFQKYGKKITIYYRPHPRVGMQHLPAALDEVGAIVEPFQVPKSMAIVTYQSTFNQCLEKFGIGPLFIFDYQDEAGSENMRQHLHQHLSQVLDKKLCAE